MQKFRVEEADAPWKSSLDKQQAWQELCHQGSHHQHQGHRDLALLPGPAGQLQGSKQPKPGIILCEGTRHNKE